MKRKEPKSVKIYRFAGNGYSTDVTQELWIAVFPAGDFVYEKTKKNGKYQSWNSYTLLPFYSTLLYTVFEYVMQYTIVDLYLLKSPFRVPGEHLTRSVAFQ